MNCWWYLPVTTIRSIWTNSFICCVQMYRPASFSCTLNTASVQSLQQICLFVKVEPGSGGGICTGMEYCEALNHHWIWSHPFTFPQGRYASFPVSDRDIWCCCSTAAVVGERKEKRFNHGALSILSQNRVSILTIGAKQQVDKQTCPEPHHCSTQFGRLNMSFWHNEIMQQFPERSHMQPPYRDHLPFFSEVTVSNKFSFSSHWLLCISECHTRCCVVRVVLKELKQLNSQSRAHAYQNAPLLVIKTLAVWWPDSHCLNKAIAEESTVGRCGVHKRVALHTPQWLS